MPMSVSKAKMTPSGSTMSHKRSYEVPTEPASDRKTLRFAAERYLPPPGPFYDQFSLPKVFGGGFFHECCFACCHPKHSKSACVSCLNSCLLCGKKNHAGEVRIIFFNKCKLLYGRDSGCRAQSVCKIISRLYK